jgi:hypothetical protein
MTTISRAKNFVKTAGRSRPATGGNKNTNARASRKGAQVPDRVTSPLKGPDRGTG